MLIYMDMCCFNRPFDSQLQQKIYLETEAKLFIQQGIMTKKYSLVWSYILDHENSANPDRDAMFYIQKWEALAQYFIVANQAIVQFAESLRNKGFGIKDALHLACAVSAGADCFITVDKGIIKKRNFVPNIKIVSPIEFIEMEDEL